MELMKESLKTIVGFMGQKELVLEKKMKEKFKNILVA